MLTNRAKSFCIVLLLCLGSIESAQAEGATKIYYGEHPTSFGELRVPENEGPFPVVVFIHGGCWRSHLGSTERYRPIAEVIAGHGIATWNIEYRRVGHEGGGWPGTFLDLGAAVDHLSQIADEYRLDLNRVVAVGHSSGGHFAAWLASRPLLPESSEIRGTPKVNLAGVVVSDAFIDPKVVESRGEDGKIYCGEPILERLIGGTPESRAEELRQISPLEWLPWHIPQGYVVSSLRYPVAPPRPLAGGRTTMVMPDYPALARKAGDDINVAVMPDAGHFDFFEQGDASYDAVISAIIGIIEKTERGTQERP